MALACGKNAGRPALLFADVADNPGGGGRGNTPYILAAFHAAGVTGCALGPVYDPELAAEAQQLRSEERRVGKECVRTCRSRGSTEHYKKKTNNNLTTHNTSNNKKKSTT